MLCIGFNVQRNYIDELLAQAQFIKFLTPFHNYGVLKEKKQDGRRRLLGSRFLKLEQRWNEDHNLQR